MNSLYLIADTSPVQIAGLAIAVILMLGLIFVTLKYGSLWWEGYNCGAQIGLIELVIMGLRQVNQKAIMKAKIKAVQAQLKTERDLTKGTSFDGTFVTTNSLEAHYLAGGNVGNIIEALVASKNAGISLEFDQAAAIDLAGRDVVEAVRTSVDPKVISCPDPQRSGKEYLSAVAKDGVELKVHAQVTVRTNLEQLIGGATEETIIARVGESIISAIGSATLHSDVLQNPGMITKAVLERGLDSQTAFEIVSIDIAGAVVGENIGSRLQVDQAAADTRVARAKAEQRRAEAIAVEQEQKAEVIGKQATLILAEAEVPKAMAEAFRTGNIETQGK
ncbi:MAG: flotillin-like protein FloA [Pirellulaceae bacterium]|tara:strand:- start:419 stop:1417 length:999 start_codon:yes stop_codon:yes gene_type:complete